MWFGLSISNVILYVLTFYIIVFCLLALLYWVLNIASNVNSFSTSIFLSIRYTNSTVLSDELIFNDFILLLSNKLLFNVNVTLDYFIPFNVAQYFIWISYSSPDIIPPSLFKYPSCSFVGINSKLTLISSLGIYETFAYIWSVSYTHLTLPTTCQV